MFGLPEIKRGFCLSIIATMFKTLI
jgi:hypothetical protein